MVDREIEIVKKTWYDVSDQKGLDIGLLFYHGLFENANHLPHFLQDDLRGQSKKFLNMMGYIINKLEDANFIHEARAIGKRYCANGMKEEHFEHFKQALFLALKTKLGEKWTPTVMVSWIWCFSMLSTIMKESAYKTR